MPVSERLARMGMYECCFRFFGFLLLRLSFVLLLDCLACIFILSPPFLASQREDTRESIKFARQRERRNFPCEGLLRSNVDMFHHSSEPLYDVNQGKSEANCEFVISFNKYNYNL